MRLRVSVILAAFILCLAPAASWADLAPYSQDFEGLDQQSPSALADDGWLIFANVFNADWSYAYGYGVFPAPNGGPGFSGIDLGQGGPAQGDQQLVVYSDYNNPDQGNNRFIEANVFQEQTIGAADVGKTWLFKFDAKRGNIEGGSVALAFFKTLDPNAGFILTNFITVEMTNIPDSWGSYSLTIFIDPALEGQILQFGFLATATAYEGSGILYDNVSFLLNADLDIKPGSFPNSINPRSRGVIPVAILGGEGFDVTEVDVSTLVFGPDGAEPKHNGHLEDANFDGHMDLVAHFPTQETGIACGDTEASISGELLDGTPFQGIDSIETVGCNRARPVRQQEPAITTPSTADSVFGSGE